MSIEFKDNSKNVLEQMSKNKNKALEMIGLKWQGAVTQEITQMKAVDTGRLRSSMTYQVDSRNDQVVVGTNVEYAPYVNYGTSRMPARPFMENSVLNHKSDYQEIVANVLGEGFKISTKI